MNTPLKKRADVTIKKTAMLIGLACVLQISESMIPHPVPGLRLGLSNMMTLIAMVDLGFGYALEVAVLRVVLSSLIVGTFMSPTFLLSLGGAVVSTLVMGFFFWISGLSRVFRMSITGISIIGAFVHNLVQLYLAYVLLVRHPGIFSLLPWLSLGSIGTGWIVGIVSGGVCRALIQGESSIASPAATARPKDRLSLKTFSRDNSWFHNLSADIKLAFLIVLAFFLLIISRPQFHMACFAGLLLLLPASKTPLGFYMSTARRYLFLILISFLLPVFFNTGGMVLYQAGFFKITMEGLAKGGLVAARILLLILSSALVMRTTSPDAIVKALTRLFWPLKFLGISRQRTAALLSTAWELLPSVWASVRQTISSADIRKIKHMRNLLPALVHLIVTLYLKADPSQMSPEDTSRTESLD